MWKLPVRYICPFIVILVSPLPVWALCCPGDANVIKSAGTGIGQPQPPATDLSFDGAWHVHAFERHGISYLQVSDDIGALQFIIGHSGEHFWLLPAGPIDTVIRLPSDPGEPAPATGLEVYRHSFFRLVVDRSGGVPVWWVEKLSALP